MKNKKKNYLLDRDDILAPLLLLPTGLYIVLFVGFPFVMAFVYSISDVTVGNPDYRIVGLRNFIDLVHDPAFLTALFNTFLFTVITVGLVLILSHILAELLMRDFHGKWLVRFLVLMPWTAPIALGAIGYLWFLDSLFSPVDWLLRHVGLLGEPGDLLGPATNMYYLGQPHLAMASVIFVQVWRLVPLGAVILLAGLNSIPREIQEAAHIDGAGYFRRLFSITLPLLFPVIGVTVLFATFFAFTDMTVVWVLTKGGPPPNTTQMLASLAFLVSIEGGDLAKGAAIAIFFFPVMAALAIVVLKLARRAVVL